MILTKILQFLNARLDVPVVMETPEQLTGYVLLDQTGSSETNHIKSITLAVQSYGSTLYEAAALSDEVAAVMQEELPELPEIASVKKETDYNYTNTNTKQHRWQAVYHITHY